MMYFYEFQYYSWEESSREVLLHEVQYSQEVFEQLLCACAEIVLKRVLARPVIEDYSAPKWYQDIHQGIVEELVAVHGFRQPQFCAQTRVFGWAGLADTEGFKQDRVPFNDRLTKHLMAAGITVDVLEAREKAVQVQLDAELADLPEE